MTYEELSIGNDLRDKINKYGRCLELLESIAKQPDHIAPFFAIPYHDDSAVDIPVELRDEFLKKMTDYYSEKMADAKAEFVALCNSGETQDDATYVNGDDLACATIMNCIKERYSDDPEVAHSRADDVLCDLLRSLGYTKTADKFDEIPKYYA